MIDIFMDSGAFTFASKGKDVSLDEYHSFILANKSSIDVASSMDVIGSWESSLANHKKLLETGFPYVPCFHAGEPIELLYEYMETSDMISIGGMVPLSYQELKVYLDNLFSKHLCGKDKYPKVKVHGFGLTDQRLMFRYPWYSVDSSTWIRVSRMGIILIPREKYGVPQWDNQPRRIQVSDKGPHSSQADTHINIMPKAHRNKVIEYIESKGFILGKSIINGADTEVVEEGLINSYKIRDIFNMKYMHELESKFPEYPSKLNIKTAPSFI